MEINDSFDELILTIKESDIYLKYDHILKQVKVNEDINKCIKDIKSIQKELVKEEHSNGQNIALLESELESKNKELNSIPLYNDYIDASLELDNLISSVRIKIETYLNDLDI